MAASLTPLLLAGLKGLLIAMTIASFTIAFVIALETRQGLLFAALAGGLVAIALVSDRARAVVTLSADWLVLTSALMSVDVAAEPRRSLGANLWVTAVASVAGAGVAFVLDEEILLVAGLALSAVAGGAFALSLKWLD